MAAEINEPIIRKLLDVIDAGLTSGIGIPEPGQMCVEAAVCYALGETHGDTPKCVSPFLRRLKIEINDARWSSDQARAKGLRRLAIAQLGTAGTLDEAKFRDRIVRYALGVSAPLALRAAASIHKDQRHQSFLRDCADRCERKVTREAALVARTAATDAAAAAAYAAKAAKAAKAAADAYAANAAYTAEDAAAKAANAAADAYAANAAADAKRDECLSTYCEDIVKILIEMETPGSKWLWLTEV
jgi:hypothetical protein